jgi:hypothetical protein
MVVKTVGLPVPFPVQIFDPHSRHHAKHLVQVSDGIECMIDETYHPLFTEDAQKSLRSFVRTITSMFGAKTPRGPGLGVAGLWLECDTSDPKTFTILFREWCDAIAFKDAPMLNVAKAVPLGETFATATIRALTIEEEMVQGVLKTPFESICAPYEQFKQSSAKALGLQIPWIMDAPIWLLTKFNDPILENTTSPVEARIKSVVEDTSDPQSPKLTMVMRYPHHEVTMTLNFRKLAEPFQRLLDRHMAMIQTGTCH